MIISKKILQHQPLELAEKTLILDIETTGFSAKYASIYLIGLVYPEENHFVTEQWLCEKESDEYELLFRFNQLLDNYPTLYHYNGDLFDLPFIKKRMALYNIDCQTYESIDLLKLFRHYKKALCLDNLKLRSIEAYFGYERVDQFSGGDLIEVYKDYAMNPQPSLEKNLLMHNFEDLVGLMHVINHLPLVALLNRLKSQTLAITLTYSTIENGCYFGKFPIDLPGLYHLEHPYFQLNMNNCELSIEIPVTMTTLYYYFPNPKDYFYLVNEDYAVHKSIGQFVAKDHRRACTKKNAYVKKEGFFLPTLKQFDLPFNLYYTKDDQKESYVAVDELVEFNGFEPYIQALLSRI